MADKKAENKQENSLVKVTPVGDYPFHETKGVALWGVQFNVAGESLIAEVEGELVSSLIEAKLVKEL